MAYFLGDTVSTYLVLHNIPPDLQGSCTLLLKVASLLFKKPQQIINKYKDIKKLINFLFPGYRDNML